MRSVKGRLLISFGFSVGLLILALGVLQGAISHIVVGLAVLASLPAIALAGHLWHHHWRTRIVWNELRTSARLHRPRLHCGWSLWRSALRRSAVGLAYRLLCALVIAGLLAGIAPPPGSVLRQAQNVAYAASEERPAARPQNQTSDAASGQGHELLEGPMGVQVNTYNGNLFYDRFDMEIPGCGLGVSLSYNVLRRNLASPFGQGWFFAYDISYREYQIVETWYATVCASGVGCWEEPRELVRNFVDIFWPDGRRSTYEAQDGSFLPPPDTDAILTRPQPGHYVLTTAEKMRFYFDSARHRHITRVEFPNGDALVFQYDAAGLLTAITDCYGRSLSLTYSNARITQVTDANVSPARVFRYAYDASGNPVSVTDPVGNVTHYGYDGDHRLTSITDPRGTVLTITYSGDRVIGLSTPLSARYFVYDAQRHQTTVMDVVQGTSRRTVYRYNAEGQLLSITDPLGNVTNQVWNNQGHLVRITNPLGRPTQFVYDSLGNLATVTNPLGIGLHYGYDTAVNQISRITSGKGQSTQFQYDGQGNLTRLTEPLERVTNYTYDARGRRLTALSDPLGRTTSFGYDTYGNLSVITSPLGTTTSFVHDAVGNRIQEILPNGAVVTSTYDAKGRPLSRTDDLGRTFAFAYDAADNLVQSVAPNGGTVQYQYDALGRLVRIIDPLGSAIGLAYDEVGNLVRATDTNRHSTLYTYDAMDRVTARTDPLGHAFTYTYDANGNLIRVTSPTGATTTYDYDAADQPTGVTDPLGNRATFERDANGNVASFTDALGHRTVFTYDEADRPTGIINPLNQTIAYGYDLADNLTVITNALGYATSFAYDALDRITSETDPLGNRVTLSYGPDNNLTAHTDAEGGTTTYTYDTASRLIRQTDPLNASIHFAYDTVDNLTAITDPLGRVTRMEYDLLDRLVAETDPLGNRTTYAYDLTENLVSRTDALGRIVNYTYDAADRALTINYSDNTPDVRYAYDSADNPTLVASAVVSLTLTYDAADRPVRMDVQYPGGLPAQVLTRTYNAAGQQTRLTSSSGIQTDYGYDAAGRLVTITHSASAPNTYLLDYDAAGQMIQSGPAAGSPGVQVQRAYDPAGRQTRVTNTNPDGTTAFADLSYAHNRIGHVTAVTATGHLSFTGLLGTTRYTYDARGQLTRVTFPDGSWEAYTYDLAGNRVGLSRSDGLNLIYAINNADQVTSGTSNQGPATTFTYDAAGNLTSRTDAGGTTHYRWDAEDRLARIDYPDGSYNAYTYDALGRRIAKRDRTGQTVSYVYDGPNLVYELNANGTVRASYAYADLDQPVSMTRGGVTYYYLYDQLGSVIGLSNGAGQLVAAYVYDPWGNLIGGNEGGIENPFRFTAREWDAESGLYFYRARYYDPRLGRFISRDPLWNPERLNRYAYVGNSPLNYTDPSGYGRSWRDWFDPVAMAVADVVSHLTVRTKGVAVQITNWYVSEENHLGLSLMSWTKYKEWFHLHFGRYHIGVITRDCSERGVHFARHTFNVITEHWRLTRQGIVQETTVKGFAKEAGKLTTWREYWQMFRGWMGAQGRGVLDVIRNNGRAFMGQMRILWQSSRQFVAQALQYGAVFATGALAYAKTMGAAVMAKVSAVASSAAAVAAAKVAAAVAAFYAGWKVGRYIGERWTDKYVYRGTSWLLDKTGVTSLMDWWYGVEKPKKKRGPCPGGCPDDSPWEEGDRPWGPNDPRPPDDTFSVASRELATVTPVYRGAPLVALLENGFAAEAGDYLSYIGQPYVIVDLNFRPDMEFPVLFIPSGGLFGLSGSALFRAKLAEYTQRGGVIVALDQQLGRDFRLLPGGQVDGHGWNEGLQCFRSAYYIQNYHQILSGFDRFYVDTPVDGEFTEFPENATVLLLTRIRNAWPGMIMYPYGQGYVFATTIYADWARWNWQASSDTRILLRDLISWAVDPQVLPEYRPGATFTLPVTLTNSTNTDAAAAQLSILTPDKTVVTTTLTSVNILSGTQTTVGLTIQLSDYPTNLGIWWVDYTLLDANGSVIQRRAGGARFVVSNPSPAADPGRDLKMWVEAPGHYFVRGMEATFRVKVRNDGDSAHTVTLQYPCGRQTFTVNPGETATIPCTLTIQASQPFDAQLYEDSTLVGRAGAAIVVVAPAVDVIPTSDRTRYRAGETALITTTLRNLQRATFDLRNFMRIHDPDGTLVYSSAFTTTLPGGATQSITRTPTLPSTIWGLYGVRVESFRDSVPLGVGVSRFEMPGPHLVVTPTRPTPYLPGITNTVTFSVTNAGYDHAPGSTLEVTLKDPDGTQLWSGSQGFDLPAGQTTALNFDIPFTARFGVFRLEHHAWQSNHHVRGITELPATHAVEFLLDKSSYSGGDPMNVNLLLKNTGVFSEVLGLELVIPVLAYTSTETVLLGPGQQVTLPHAVNLPLDISGGTYPINLTLTLGADRDRRASYFVVLPADLDPRLVPEDHVAGGPLRLTVRNRGGGQTAYACQASLQDTEGRLVLSSTIIQPVILPGEIQTTTLTIPTGVRAGTYYLRNECTAADSGRVTVLARLLPIGGVQARLSVSTDDDLYLIGQPVTVTGVITNVGSYDIISGTLELAVISTVAAAERLGGTVYDLYSGNPVPGARVVLDTGEWVYTTLSGQFFFGEMTAREYTVSVYRAGYQVYQAQHTLRPETAVNIYLVPTIQAELSGLVQVGTNVTRVVGADLTLTPITVTATEARSLYVRSRFDGYYVFPVAPAGTYTLTVSAPGFPSFVWVLTLPGGSCTQNIPLGTANALDPCPVLRGQMGLENRHRWALVEE